MNKIFILVLVLVVLAGGGYWYMNMYTRQSIANPEDFGTYAYECDEHVTFALVPSEDMKTLRVTNSSMSAYPPNTVVTRIPSTSGGVYEGNNLRFVAHGETITLGEGDSTINCSPVPNTELAPLNFGD